MIDERIALNLDNMRTAALDATSFLRDMTQVQFLADEKSQLACAMCLVIVGEGTAKIEKRSPEFVADHPDWPWDQIRGLRNRIVHDYFTLDLTTIWLTVKDHLPRLITSIADLGEIDPRLAPTDPPHSSS
jgi:uncharacterized protein with HEPN domain